MILVELLNLTFETKFAGGGTQTPNSRHSVVLAGACHRFAIILSLVRISGFA
jgi:hypothetical protein